MPICNGCRETYDDDFNFCPHCARPNPRHSPSNMPSPSPQQPARHEFCVLKSIVEKQRSGGLSGKLGGTDDWICIVAVHQSTGRELYRARMAANLYVYWHGSRKAQDEVRILIETSKTEVWQYLEENGWEYCDSEQGGIIPHVIFRRARPN